MSVDRLDQLRFISSKSAASFLRMRVASRSSVNLAQEVREYHTVAPRTTSGGAAQAPLGNASAYMRFVLILFL